MATVLPLAQHHKSPDEFVEALNGLAVGVVGLQFVRRSLSAALAADDRLTPMIRSLLEEVYQDGRLSAADYEVLCGDLGPGLGEDEPTDSAEALGVVPGHDATEPADASAAGSPGASRPSRVSEGTVLRERYVLQSRVVANSMTKVFKALDLRRKEAGAADPWVAIKIAGPGVGQSANGVKFLQQEATLARRLVHANIVRIFDFDREGDYALLTMEWLEGESLAEHLTRQRYRPVAAAHARKILNEIGAALATAHRSGIIHADVKPGNIFLTRSGTAKLLDFGVARSQADAQSGQAAARTPAYASCEVLEGATPTPQDDVYSLACVAYRMLGGRRVFGHHDALAAERAGRSPSRIHLSAGQWAALEQALAFRRGSRTPDIATFLRAFNTVPPTVAAPVTASPVEAMPAPEIAAGSPHSKRPWWISIAAGMVFAIGAWVLFRPGSGTVADGGAQPETEAVPDAVQVAPPEREHAEATPAAAEKPSPSPVTALVKQQAPVPTREDRGERVAPKPAQSGDRPVADQPKPKPVAMTPRPPETRVRLRALAAPRASLAVAAPQIGPQAAAAPPLAPVPEEAAQPSGTAIAEVGLDDLKFKRYVKPEVRVPERGHGSDDWVRLTFTVTTEGATRDIEIIEANPPGRNDAAVLKAVRRWRFEPVVENGHPVEKRTRVRLRFQ